MKDEEVSASQWEEDTPLETPSDVLQGAALLAVIPRELWPLLAQAYEEGALFLRRVEWRRHLACEGRGCSFCCEGKVAKPKFLALGPDPVSALPLGLGAPVRDGRRKA